MKKKDLIYDIGMHKGADTAHYLSAGYRVVAVEADPSLAGAARQRFSSAIESGQLTILEIAIGPEEDILPFWISTNPEYNSFSKENASKWGESSHMIEVPARPFEDVLSEYGEPYYLKVDIEGADHYCIEALNPSGLPTYLSFEKDQLGDLHTAYKLGYTRFKLISQENFRQLIYTPGSSQPTRTLKNRISSKLKSGAKRTPGVSYLNRLLKNKNANTKARDVKKYAYGSSGPFGEDTDGPWRTFEEVAFTWLAFNLGYTKFKNPEWEDWFDVHCAR